jgi:hypothetical protein
MFFNFFFESRSFLIFLIEQISLGGEALLIFSWEERISREISFFGISEFAVFFDSEFRLEFRHFPWFGPKQDFPPFFQHVGRGRRINWNDGFRQISFQFVS